MPSTDPNVVELEKELGRGEPLSPEEAEKNPSAIRRELNQVEETERLAARRLYPNDQEKQKGWMKLHQKRLLDKGKIAKLVGVLRALKPPNPEVAEKIRTEADYFQRNAQRMRYPRFRRLHLFVGSGVIEAGCKTVVASRLKRSGMFWTVRGANAILALRCACLNGRFEDYWERRREPMAA